MVALCAAGDSTGGVYFCGEYYCWLLLEPEKVLLADGAWLPPGETPDVLLITSTK